MRYNKDKWLIGMELFSIDFHKSDLIDVNNKILINFQMYMNFENHSEYCRFTLKSINRLTQRDSLF